MGIWKVRCKLKRKLMFYRLLVRRRLHPDILLTVPTRQRGPHDPPHKRRSPKTRKRIREIRKWKQSLLFQFLEIPNQGVPLQEVWFPYWVSAEDEGACGVCYTKCVWEDRSPETIELFWGFLIELWVLLIFKRFMGLILWLIKGSRRG